MRAYPLRKRDNAFANFGKAARKSDRTVSRHGLSGFDGVELRGQVRDGFAVPFRPPTLPAHERNQQVAAILHDNIGPTE